MAQCDITKQYTRLDINTVRRHVKLLYLAENSYIKCLERFLMGVIPFKLQEVGNRLAHTDPNSHAIYQTEGILIPVCLGMLDVSILIPIEKTHLNLDRTRPIGRGIKVQINAAIFDEGIASTIRVEVYPLLISNTLAVIIKGSSLTVSAIGQHPEGQRLRDIGVSSHKQNGFCDSKSY
jgi:hypothetical protein